MPRKIEVLKAARKKPRSGSPRLRVSDSPSVAQRIRNRSVWQRVRADYRRRHPLCEDPLGVHAAAGRPVPAEEVHHIVPLRERPELAYSQSNLMAVCRDCHAAIEKQSNSTSNMQHSTFSDHG